MGVLVCPTAYGANPLGLCLWCGAPRPDGRDRWCSDLCADTFRQNHVWRSARAAALTRAARRCRACGSRTGLQVHHIDPVGSHGYAAGCCHHQENLIVLCDYHHREADEARRRAGRGWPNQLSILTAA